MPSPTGAPLRVIGVLAGLAVAAAATVGVAYLVREGAPGTGAIPAPGTPSLPSPSASATLDVSAAGPSPTPTTPEELKAKNIAEAKARLVEYYATTAEVANGGYVDWEEKLLPFWGHPDIWQPLSRRYAQLADQGLYTTGAARVSSIEVVDYVPSDVGLEEVHMRACIDFSEVVSYDASGTVIPRDAMTPMRYEFNYAMRHQGHVSVWTIDAEEAIQEASC